MTLSNHLISNVNSMSYDFHISKKRHPNIKNSYDYEPFCHSNDNNLCFWMKSIKKKTFRIFFSHIIRLNWTDRDQTSSHHNHILNEYDQFRFSFHFNLPTKQTNLNQYRLWSIYMMILFSYCFFIDKRLHFDWLLYLCLPTKLIRNIYTTI